MIFVESAAINPVTIRSDTDAAAIVASEDGRLMEKNMFVMSMPEGSAEGPGDPSAQISADFYPSAVLRLPADGASDLDVPGRLQERSGGAELPAQVFPAGESFSRKLGQCQ